MLNRRNAETKRLSHERLTREWGPYRRPANGGVTDPVTAND